MVVKDRKYSIYTGDTTYEQLLALVKRGVHAGPAENIPAKKSAFEILTMQTRDNLRGLSKVVDTMGLKGLPLAVKAIIAGLILFLPIIAVYMYVRKTLHKDEQKLEVTKESAEQKPKIA